MASDPYLHAREIGEKALAIPVEERDAYVEKACSGDAELRKRVDAWLAGQGLDMSATRSVTPTISEQSSEHEKDSEQEPDLGVTLPANRARKPGRAEHATFGKYSLVREIGQGGNGDRLRGRAGQPKAPGGTEGHSLRSDIR